MTTKVVSREVAHVLDERGVLGSALPASGFTDDPNASPGWFSAGRPSRVEQKQDGVVIEWTTDFTVEQEVEWERIIRRARRKAEEPDDDVLDGAITTLKQWHNRAGTANNAQRDATLDAIVAVLRQLLKDD